MKSVKFIAPKKLNKYIPKEYYSWSSISPYYVPLFGIFFWKRLKKIIKIILKNQNKVEQKFKNILDIGCGISFLSINLGINNPDAKINGIDILEEWQNKYIEKIVSKYYKNFNMITHDIQTQTHFPEDHFDLIIALDVLEHITNLESAIDEIKRILKKKGKFIITVPAESIILQYMRRIYANTSKRMVCDGHWKGDISSVKMFKESIEKHFKVEKYQTYPYSNFPLTFSYGILYILTKK